MIEPREPEKADARRMPPIGGICPQTARLIELLQATDKEVLTDEEMTAACGRQTRSGGNGYGNLHTAVGYVFRTTGVLWERIHRAGAIQRLDDKGKITCSDKHHRSGQRKTRRSVEALRAVDAEGLPAEQRRDFLATLAQRQTLLILGRTDTRKKLAARNVADPLDVRKLLAQMTPTPAEAAPSPADTTET